VGAPPSGSFGRGSGRPIHALLVAATFVTGTAGGQQATVADAGSFTILQGGAKIGREVFTIRLTTAPDVGYLAEGSAVYPTRRLLPVLRTDSSGAPLRYEVEEFVADRRQQQLTLQVTRGRGSERVQTRQGESASEFLVAPGARLLDDDIFAYYYFIARLVVPSRHLGTGQVLTLPLLMPRRASTTATPVTVLGDEQVEVAGVSRAAVHIRIGPAQGEVRELWADATGRVLRVSAPGRGTVAVRDDLPL
jgi:hypothetical protein